MLVISDPWIGWTTTTSGCNGTCTSGYPATMNLAPGSIDAYEGPNECNSGGGNCTIYGTSGASYPWPTGVLNVWEPEIYTLKAPGIAIYGPAASNGDFSQYPYLAGYMDYTALHDDATPNNPENGRTQAALASSATHLSGGDPAVTTETGYATGPPYTEYGAESRLAQERYIGREIAFRLNPSINVHRMYIYELFDFPTSACNSSDASQCRGLLDASYNPKPAWTRLVQLMSYFADTGISPQTPLAYTLSGDTTGKLWQDLFQKSNGTYILVPWLGTLQWDWRTDTDVAPTTETLTLKLPSSVASVTLTQFGDNGAQTVTTISCSNGKISLPVSSLIETVSFHT